MQVQKHQHTQGSGRQLGNVQVVRIVYDIGTRYALHVTMHCLQKH